MDKKTTLARIMVSSQALWLLTLSNLQSQFFTSCDKSPEKVRGSAGELLRNGCSQSRWCCRYESSGSGLV